MISAARDVPPPARPRQRSGNNPIERKAVLRVQRDVAAMPASLVVQLALWPDDIAHWARAERMSESLVYNALARRKPYRRVRERLAARLEVSTAVLAHLIDAARPLPTARRAPESADGPGAEDTSPIDWTTPPYPMRRDGTNPIERRAVRVVGLDVASMPASAVVGLALWPQTLAAWSREHRLKPSVVSATLAGSPSDRVRTLLARRLDASPRELDDLIATPRRESRSAIPPAPADSPSADAPSERESSARLEPRPEAPPEEPREPPPRGGQMHLGF